MRIKFSNKFPLLLAALGAPSQLAEPLGSDSPFVLAVLLACTVTIIAFKRKARRRRAELWCTTAPLLLVCLYLLGSSVFYGHPALVLATILRFYAVVGLLALALIFSSENFRGVQALSGLKPLAAISIVTVTLSILDVLSFQDGYSGQHYYKFFCVVSFVCALAVLVEGARYRFSLKAAWVAAATLSLVLVLQRGALVAAFTSVLALVALRRWLSVRMAVSLLAGALVLVGSAAMYQEMLVEYFFFSNFGPLEMLSALREGSFSLDMIRSRGRIDMAYALLGSFDITPFGYGYGVSKNYIGEAFFEGREAHNDALSLLVDAGYIGLISVYGSILWPAVYLRRRVRDANANIPLTLDAGFSLLLGMAVWSILSNVFIYSSVALALPYCVMCLHLPTRRALSNSARGSMGQRFNTGGAFSSHTLAG